MFVVLSTCWRVSLFVSRFSYKDNHEDTQQRSNDGCGGDRDVADQPSWPEAGAHSALGDALSCSAACGVESEIVPTNQAAAAEEILLDLVLQAGGKANVKDLKDAYTAISWLKDAVGDLRSFVADSQLLELSRRATGTTGEIRIANYDAIFAQMSRGPGKHMASRKQQLWRWRRPWKSSRRHDGRRFVDFTNNHTESYAKLLANAESHARRAHRPRPATQPFDCLLTSLRELGIPVADAGPGPFLALSDGNRLLQQFGLALVRVQPNKLTDHEPALCIIHQDHHFEAMFCFLGQAIRHHRGQWVGVNWTDVMALAFNASVSIFKLTLGPADTYVASDDRLGGMLGFEMREDDALRAALKLSRENSNREQAARAKELLRRLGDVKCNGEALRLCVDPVLGDGFCWYRCLAAQANMRNHDDGDVHLMAMCALTELAKTPERSYSNESAVESDARREHLSTLPEYNAIMHDLDDFDIYIIDKIESVVVKNVADGRHYADNPEIYAFLTHTGVTAAVLEVDSPEDGGVPVCLLPHEEEVSVSEKLHNGEVDAFFVHYQRPSHYNSVKDTRHKLWTMPREKIGSIVAKMSAWTLELPALHAALTTSNIKEVPRAARLELVRFVLHQKQPLYECTELMRWCEWKAFASRYSFIPGERRADFSVPRQWLSQHCHDLSSERMQCWPEATQWFFGQQYVLFAAIRSGDGALFRELCRASCKPNAPETDSDACLDDAQRTFSQSAVDIVHTLFKIVAPSASAALSFRGMRFASVGDMENTLITTCAGNDARDPVFSCSRHASVAMRFMDPRDDEVSALTMRLQRRRLSKKPYECGMLVIFDGIRAFDVSGLNVTTIDEGEVWLEHCRMFVAFRSHDPNILATTLRTPLPVTGKILAQQDVDQIVACASARAVRLDVVVLTSQSLVWCGETCLADSATLDANAMVIDTDHGDRPLRPSTPQAVQQQLQHAQQKPQQPQQPQQHAQPQPQHAQQQPQEQQRLDHASPQRPHCPLGHADNDLRQDCNFCEVVFDYLETRQQQNLGQANAAAAGQAEAVPRVPNDQSTPAAPADAGMVGVKRGGPSEPKVQANASDDSQPKNRLRGKQVEGSQDNRNENSESTEPPPMPHPQSRPERKARKISSMASLHPCDDEQCGTCDSVGHAVRGKAAPPLSKAAPGCNAAAVKRVGREVVSSCSAGESGSATGTMSRCDEDSNAKRQKRGETTNGAVMLRKLLPRWTDAFASGEKLVEFVGYAKGHGNAMKRFAAGTVMVVSCSGTNSVAAVAVAADRAIVRQNAADAPAALALVPTSLRAGRARIFVRKGILRLHHF